MGKNRLPRGVRVSGSVNHNGKIIGATSKYVIRSLVPDGHAMLSASGSSSSGPYILKSVINDIRIWFYWRIPMILLSHGIKTKKH